MIAFGSSASTVVAETELVYNCDAALGAVGVDGTTGYLQARRRKACDRVNYRTQLANTTQTLTQNTRTRTRAHTHSHAQFTLMHLI